MFLSYNILGDILKKVGTFLLICVIIIFYYFIINSQESIVNKASGNASIDEFYIYGRYFNVFGHIDGTIDADKAYLIFANNKEEVSYQLNISGNNPFEFYLTDKINGGINLEDLNLANYY